MMYLIIGLGNYPKQYLTTRHNIGFMVIDKLCEKLNVELTTNKFDGWFARIKNNGNEFIIAKAYTLMNLSGNFVSQIVNFYKINPSNILVISDDVDGVVGSVKIKTNGSSGGHNGLKDIINKLGTEKFNRIKLGVDKPYNKNMDLAEYVLLPFSNEQINMIDLAIDSAVEIIYSYIDGTSIKSLMNAYNGTEKRKIKIV